jgi:micrococcal nuclease
MLRALTCPGCGGAVGAEPGRTVPRCLFCGRDDLVEAPLPESVEPPRTVVPFRVGDEAARDAFRQFASRSIWYPADLRDVAPKLARVYVPAWVFEADVETAWAALVPAATRSGKRPASGRVQQRLGGVLIPASPALTQKEIDGLLPFDREGEAPFDALHLDAPFELGSLTRSVARIRAHAAMSAEARRRVDAEVAGNKLATSHLVHGLDGEPIALPVWIGAYRYGNNAYRVLLNGESGVVFGRAPISVARIVGAIVAAFVVLATVLELSGCSPASRLPAAPEPCRDAVRVTVDAFIDGDTADVTFADGSQERVRLLGVDTPEIDHDDVLASDFCAVRAWDESKALLDGEAAWLTFDTSCTDVYGRTLAYMFRAEDELWLNEHLLREGYARFYDEFDFAYFEAFEDLEADAQGATAGMWGGCE